MDYFEDWLGQTVKVGDRIIYPVRTGSSVNLVLAEVLEINRADLEYRNTNRYFTVRAQPLIDHRWGPTPRKVTRYIDTRSGKGVDPYKHVKSWGKYSSTDDRYLPTQFEDYVEEIEMPAKPVTLTAVENIVKVRVNE